MYARYCFGEPERVNLSGIDNTSLPRDCSNDAAPRGRPAMTTTEIVPTELDVRVIAPHEHHLLECCTG
jgi:hypothetical protein